MGPVHYRIKTYDLPYIFTVLQNNYGKNNPIPCFISTNEIGNATASLSLLMFGQAKEDGIIEKEAYALR